MTCRQEECSGLRGERPAEWIRAGKFASRTDEGTVLVRGFDGYPCLREHEAFLCNELLSNHEANLETLYAAMPELLRESVDEEQPADRLEQPIRPPQCRTARLPH